MNTSKILFTYQLSTTYMYYWLPIHFHVINYRPVAKLLTLNVKGVKKDRHASCAILAPGNPQYQSQMNRRITHAKNVIDRCLIAVSIHYSCETANSFERYGWLGKVNLRETAEGSCHTSHEAESLPPSAFSLSTHIHTYSRFSHFSAHVLTFHSSCLSKNIIFQAHLRASCP